MQYDYLKKGNRVLWGDEEVTIKSEIFYPYARYNEETDEWERETIEPSKANPSEHYVTVEYRHIDGNLCYGTTVNELREADVRIDQLTEICDIYDLDQQEVEDCFNEWHRGSVYLHHYENTYGVLPKQAMECYDAFYAAIRREFGDDVDKHDNAQEFYMYLCGENM